MADRITCTIYDGIVKTAILGYPCSEQASWERVAVQVGEINEEAHSLYGAELDACSYGSSFDLRLMEELLHLNGDLHRYVLVSAYTRICCLMDLVRLQSHFDSTPVCILRYRPTKEVAEILRELMSECSDVLSQCHIHVVLKGSQFDNEACRNHVRQSENGADVEVRVSQPTMSSANMVVGDIISGKCVNLV
ncbi:unnamed protein product [Porites evermanni]|uniref:Uncharacterized protein n=1 Tax=Porites evermanni TaxID=104178 RepID=A0ABN8LWI4_9CNID|nr:unnamed protein product [Porites evermanni]